MLSAVGNCYKSSKLLLAYSIRIKQERGGMMYSKIYTYIPLGFEAISTVVEASILPGLPSFSISGLANGRSRDVEARLRAAILNTGLQWPRGRIIVAIAPAWMAKAGSLYDLPIALAIVEASGQVGVLVNNAKFTVIGELALSGKIREVPGIFTCLEEASKREDSYMLLPEGNCREAENFPHLNYIPVSDLGEVLDYYRQVERPKRKKYKERDTGQVRQDEQKDFSQEDRQNFIAFQGQEIAKRGLEIALSGWHSLILLGSPGSGKTMLLSLARSLLPPLSPEENYVLKKIYSIAGKQDSRIANAQRPFFSPHFSLTKAALTGGGTPIKPGLFSLAHRGILFLDELTEYNSSKLECLREALSEKEIFLARSNQNVTLPADFLLLAAANPCPCGFAVDRFRACRCPKERIQQYLQKISEPVWDRFHLALSISAENKYFYDLTEKKEKEKEVEFYQLKARVERAWTIQKERHRKVNRVETGMGFHNSSSFHIREAKKYGISDQLLRYTNRIAEEFHISMRSYTQILRIARTIADLADLEIVSRENVEEAIFFQRTKYTMHRGSL